MRTDYAALALVVDRSGSMHSIADDTRGSIKQFIESQQGNEGEASLTVAQFDHEYTVVYAGDLKKIDADKIAREYEPRGTTALLDAIGRTIIELGNKLEATPEADRPARTVVAIVTDGYENASRDFTADKIRELIAEKEKAGWDFLFLSATLDAMQVAEKYGFDATKTAYFSACNVGSAVKTIGDQVTQAREGKVVGISDDVRNTLKA